MAKHMLKSLPSTKTLTAFITTAQHLNLTHAAKELNLTQGAISRQIQSLEQHIGSALFYRHARGLSLTHKGKQLKPLIEQTLIQLSGALTQVSSMPERIRLNAPSCITSWLLPRLIAFQQKYPDIDVELTSTIKHRFEPNFEPFDSVIIYGQPPSNTAISSHVLFEECLTPMCRPELLEQELATIQNFERTKRSSNTAWSLSPKDLTQYTWLHANEIQSDWTMWLEKVGAAGSISKNNQHFATLDQAMNASLQGFGVAIGDVTLAEQDLMRGLLITPHAERIYSGNGYYLIQPKSRKSSALTTLIHWLLD